MLIGTIKKDGRSTGQNMIASNSKNSKRSKEGATKRSLVFVVSGSGNLLLLFNDEIKKH